VIKHNYTTGTTHGGFRFYHQMGANNENNQNAYQRAKFEIHMVLLEKVELNDIIPHCLRILHKIDGQVGLDSEEQQVTSYLQVLPRNSGATVLMEASCSGI
jgi:hypothetical protein